MQPTRRSQPTRRRKKIHGFRARSKSVLASRREKGRKELVKV